MSVLTIDPAFYKHSIQLDAALVGRADPRLTIFRTGAFRGLMTLFAGETSLFNEARRRLRRTAADTPSVDTRELEGMAS